MKFVFLSLSFLSTLHAAEVKWDILKGLEVDLKTKKQIISKELTPVIGKEITLKGYMMPLDYSNKNISEFLFMPYIPACMHVPPPPANQLVWVKMKKGAAIQPSVYPVELTGVIKVEANAELESSYKMDGIKLKELK